MDFCGPAAGGVLRGASFLATPSDDFMIMVA